MVSTRANLIGMLFLNPTFTAKGIAEKCTTKTTDVEAFFRELSAVGIIEHDAPANTWRRTSKAGLTEGAMMKQAAEAGVDLSVPLARP
jgi:hypothetical protein